MRLSARPAIEHFREKGKPVFRPKMRQIFKKAFYGKGLPGTDPGEAAAS